MNANEVFFYAAIGGAIIIVVYGGIQIMRKYPRLPNGQRLPLSELKAIRASLADVKAGRTKPLEEIRQELQWKATERERIRRQEVCSDKSHWKQPRADQ